ncbi:hypothetical protein RCDURKIN_122 [Rhodobacter phage RcDurkin]|nr:hypothetical protein RCDURKIN_122 [Rhodobacter phage RcDurkin]QXN72591.1 hypothetical protein RCTIPTONUS_121 [Rhodobacter phage RcTiptonus]UUV44492.1 hypothetical protein RCMENCHIE_123 [Rhodobacter phage RcMenchie]
MPFNTEKFAGDLTTALTRALNLFADTTVMETMRVTIIEICKQHGFDDTTPCFSVENHGSVFLIRAHTDDATAQLQLMKEEDEDLQFFGSALAVEPRYVEQVIEQLRGAGFTFT